MHARGRKFGSMVQQLSNFEEIQKKSSSTAFQFLQQLSNFFNRFPISSTVVKIFIS
jgi:hypothetical protein